jgi:branched-chain amino acid transport system permease protein
VIQLVLGQLINGVIVGTLYGIVAAGITLTFGITGIVNFALGAFMTLGAYVAWYLTDVAGLSFPVSVALSVLATMVAGVIADQVLFRHTRNNLINGLLVSIGLIAVMEAGILMTWSATPKEMEFILPGVVNAGGLIVPKMKAVVAIILLTVVIATYLALTRTWMGRAAFAYAQNPEAARLMGVRTKLLESGVFVYSIGLCGLGGALYASLYSIDAGFGGTYVLKGVEAAILAGIGSVGGALVGGILLGVAEAIGSIFFPAAFKDAYGLIALVLILLLKPGGIFGGK